MKLQDKKTTQLGINPGTAQHRLVKDILWSFIVKLNLDTCCKCGSKMCRKTFSIEHVVPWLDSENPVELFFNLDNISFSHLKCNISDRRINNKWEDREAYKNHERNNHKEYQRKKYCPEKRRKRYLEKGI